MTFDNFFVDVLPCDLNIIGRLLTTYSVDRPFSWSKDYIFLLTMTIYPLIAQLLSGSPNCKYGFELHLFWAKAFTPYSYFKHCASDIAFVYSALTVFIYGMI